MTVIQAIRSEKYADVEGSVSPRNPEELPQDLATMRAEYETYKKNIKKLCGRPKNRGR